MTPPPAPPAPDSGPADSTGPADWARRLQEAGQGTAVLADRPRRICELCVDELDVSGAGITLVTREGNRGAVCATDDVAARIEDLQLTLGVGPCVDAATSGGPVLVPDLQSPEDVAVQRWPAFMTAAEAAGVRAVFAFPLRIGAIHVGVLDMYRDTPGPLTHEQLPAALAAADVAALALLQLEEGMQDLLSPIPSVNHHAQVHQATGMVQAQLGVSTQEAFLLLRARAFATGRSLTDVARGVVERRERFSEEDP